LNEIDEIDDQFVTESTFSLADDLIEQIDGLNRELEVLHRPGIKLATIKLLGAAKHKLRPRTRLKEFKRRLCVSTRIRNFATTQKNKKKDGLIISLSVNNNYGNLILRYALKTFLKKNSYNFDVARIKPDFDDISKEFYSNTIRFSKKYLDEIKFDAGQLFGYGNYVVGSDQIWRADCWRMHGGRTPYILEFIGNRRANRLAYGASFGMNTLKESGYDDNLIQEVRPFINKFNGISVREQSAIGLVDELAGKAKKAKLVVDPTLLLTKDDYSELIDNSQESKTETPSVFSYCLTVNDDFDRAVRKISREFSGDYKIVKPYSGEVFISVEEWLKGFRDSEFVVTDSFHGSVFSIINHRDFIVIINPTQAVDRIFTLFDSLGIDRDRLIFTGDTGLLDISILRPINWQKVDKKLVTLQKESGDWLLNGLKGNRK
jgi:hypothetical protein